MRAPPAKSLNPQQLNQRLQQYTKQINHEDNLKVESNRKKMHDLLKIRFLKTDTNKDSLISSSEMRKNFPEFLRHFTKADADQNHGISLPEFLLFEKKYMTKKTLLESKNHRS